jgi:hypothetical protein
VFDLAIIMPARRLLVILNRFCRFSRNVSSGVKRTSRKCRLTNFAKSSLSSSSILLIALRVKSRAGDTCSISTLSASVGRPRFEREFGLLIFAQIVDVAQTGINETET